MRILKRHGAAGRAAAVQHIEAIQPVLNEARSAVDKLMGNAVNERVRNACWQQQIRNLESGLEELNNL